MIQVDAPASGVQRLIVFRDRPWRQGDGRHCESGCGDEAQYVVSGGGGGTQEQSRRARGGPVQPPGKSGLRLLL